MIYLKYHGVVAATAAGPMGLVPVLAGVASGPDPAQALWAGDVDDVAYYLIQARLRPAGADLQDLAPEPDRKP